MAYVITDECVACGTCAEACPAEAISEGDGKYVCGLLHHITKQQLCFFCAVSKFTELDLTVCQILTCKRAANLIIVDFFYLHIITSYL